VGVKIAWQLLALEDTVDSVHVDELNVPSPDVADHVIVPAGDTGEDVVSLTVAVTVIGTISPAISVEGETSTVVTVFTTTSFIVPALPKWPESPV